MTVTDLRLKMEGALKADVISLLRARGFKGSLPHFRRKTELGIDLLTFQFDRNGGGFVIEISRSPVDGVTTHWGKVIAPEKVSALDLHPDKRHRIKAMDGSGTDAWFRYEDGDVKRVSKQVIEKIPLAELWWASHV